MTKNWNHRTEAKDAGSISQEEGQVCTASKEKGIACYYRVHRDAVTLLP